jgi:hypothetical protein
LWFWFRERLVWWLSCAVAAAFRLLACTELRFRIIRFRLMVYRLLFMSLRLLCNLSFGSLLFSRDIFAIRSNVLQ